MFGTNSLSKSRDESQAVLRNTIASFCLVPRDTITKCISMRTTSVTTSENLLSGGKATTEEHIFVHSVSDFLSQSKLNLLSGAQLRGDVILTELRTFAALYGNGNKAQEAWIAFVGHHAAEQCHRKLHSDRTRWASTPLVVSCPAGCTRQFVCGSRVIRSVLHEAMAFVTDHIVASTRSIQTQISPLVHFMEQSGVIETGTVAGSQLLALRLGGYLRASLEGSSSMPLGETDWSLIGARVAAEAFTALLTAFTADVGQQTTLQSVVDTFRQVVESLDDPHRHFASFVSVESRVGRSSSPRTCFAVRGYCFFIRSNQAMWVSSQPNPTVRQREESQLAAVLMCTDLELASDRFDSLIFDRVIAMANVIADSGWNGSTRVIGVFVEMEFDSATRRRIDGWPSRLRSTRLHHYGIDLCVVHSLGKRVMYKLSTSLGVLQNSMPLFPEEGEGLSTLDCNWRWWICPTESLHESVISLRTDEVGEDASVYSSHRSAVLRSESMLSIRLPSTSLSPVSVVLSAATSAVVSALELSFWQCFSKLINDFGCEVKGSATNTLVPDYGFLELLASCSLQAFLDSDVNDKADIESAVLRREIVTSLQNSMRQYLVLILQQSLGFSIEKAMDHVGACVLNYNASSEESSGITSTSTDERVLLKWFYQNSIPLPPLFPLDDVDSDFKSVLACDIKDWCSLDTFLGSVACIFRVVETQLTTGVVGVNA